MRTKSENSVKSGLSKREALALTRLAAQNKKILTIEDIGEVIDIPYEEAKKVANNLVHKKWLDRLKSGTYLIVPLEAGEKGEYTEHEYVIASHLADPMYISYWTALNYHSLTEQVPLTVYAATTERVPTREIHDVTYQFITITEKKFFGYSTESIGACKISVASVEKAIADCADHPEYCGGITELGKALKNTEDLDTETLADYLVKIGNGAAIKRIVYFADLYGIDLENREMLEDAFTKGYSKLDPTRGDGKHSRKYRLQLNVPEDELTNLGEKY